MDEGRESERGPELSVEPTGQISDRKFSRVRVCSVPGLSHPQPARCAISTVSGPPLEGGDDDTGAITGRI